MREGLGVETHTGLGIYAWQRVHVHVFGPVYCASVGMCAHMSMFVLICIDVYVCSGIITWCPYLN